MVEHRRSQWALKESGEGHVDGIVSGETVTHLPNALEKQLVGVPLVPSTNAAQDVPFLAG